VLHAVSEDVGVFKLESAGGFACF